AAVPPALHVVSAGTGPQIVLVHGSAADATTWSIQLASTSLRERFTLLAYDRRARVDVAGFAENAAAVVARRAGQGGPAAGEFFLRTVLGDAQYERIPRMFQDRSKARWAEIRADSAALIAYRPRYAELAEPWRGVRTAERFARRSCEEAACHTVSS